MTLRSWTKRAEIKSAIRRFFSDKNYLEIDTPVLVTCPGTEVYIEYFETHWNDFRGQAHKVWLRSSPELHMKQALAEGCDRIFQMGPCFRNNGEYADWHSPEFTMLEWYEKGIEFEDYIGQTFDLMQDASKSIGNQSQISELFNEPPKILTVNDAYKEFLGIDFEDEDQDLAKKLAHKNLPSLNQDDDFETTFSKVLFDCFEKEFSKMGLVVLKDYPASQAALAVIEGRVARRFEFYINGIEICNAFKEALDPKENKQRYQSALNLRGRRGASQPPHDLEFYAALEKGVEACCGNALGVDRFIGILLGEKNLDQVQPFRQRTPFGKSNR